MKNILVIIGCLIIIIAPIEGVFISRAFKFVEAENISIVLSVMAQIGIGAFLIFKNIKFE